MYDCEFVNHSRFFILEHLSNEDIVSENWTNNEDVQHLSFVKNRFSNEDRQFRENHDLFLHFFFWIFRTCEFYFSRVSICTSKIRMSIFDWIVFESILIVIVTSNFFKFLMKWINSYLIKTNTNSCRIVRCS